MKDSEIRRLLSTALSCLAQFEDIVSELYSILSEFSHEEAARLALRWISTESRQHSKYLGNLAKLLGLGGDVGSCAEFVGIPWVTVESLLNNLRKAGSLSNADVLNTLRKLHVIERFTAEEAYSAILIKQIKDVANLARINFGIIEVVLDEIVEEEKYHDKIVTALIEMLESRN
ncbi:MAG: hypothetical protein RMH84_02725 [Sulfolobales archaeon]|nr:hypothetical protein [Sulfolobales archaeon]